MGNIDTFKRADVLFKFIELVLSCTCLGLTSTKFFSGDLHKNEVVIGTFISFTILGSVIVISYFLDTPIHKKLLMVIAVVGAGLFITSGAFVLEHYDKGYKTDEILAGGIIALINGVIYILDVYLSYRSA